MKKSLIILALLLIALSQSTGMAQNDQLETKLGEQVANQIRSTLASKQTGENVATQLPLVPYPQNIQSGPGTFIPKKDLLLTYANVHPALAPIAHTCAADLAGIGFSASHNPTDPDASAKLTGTIQLIIEDDASLAEEGYRLKIDKNISISAATADGLFWGTRTLLQLLKSGPQKAIPQLYHYFINRMHQVVKNKGRKMLVWEGFDPTLTPKIDQEIIVCPFDVKHKGHMPSDYFNAGYKVLNTSWSPLYVADNISMCTPETIARWSPYMFGAGRSPQPLAYWKKFNPQTHHPKIIGAQMCSRDNEEKAEEGLLLGTGPGFPEYGRPAPRLQIMAERVWSGSQTTPQSLLERVGAHYW